MLIRHLCSGGPAGSAASADSRLESIGKETRTIVGTVIVRYHCGILCPWPRYRACVS